MVGDNSKAWLLWLLHTVPCQRKGFGVGLYRGRGGGGGGKKGEGKKACGGGGGLGGGGGGGGGHISGIGKNVSEGRDKTS